MERFPKREILRHCECQTREIGGNSRKVKNSLELQWVLPEGEQERTDPQIIDREEKKQRESTTEEERERLGGQ